MSYGFANRLGFGYCQPCANEREEKLDQYSTDPDGETCESCGKDIAQQYRAPERPGIVEYFTCKIY